MAISIDQELLKRVDMLVKEGKFESRSAAFQAAIGEKIERMKQTRLETECALLSKYEEKNLAEESLEKDRAAWPEY